MGQATGREQAIAMRELPAQRIAEPLSGLQERARFFNSGNAFNIVYPPVPHHQFVIERDRAFEARTGTALIPLDLSRQLLMPAPATTPLTLACYARIAADDTLDTRFRASGEIYYVINGRGRTQSGDVAIDWKTGDVFCLPGGVESRHTAADDDAILWIVSNQPALVFEGLTPPSPADAPIDPVHYPSAEIDRQLDLLYRHRQDPDDAGMALVFSADRQEASRNIMPSLTLAMNTLPPGAQQRPHRHNSVALNLPVQGAGCYSVVDGKRVDWQPHAMTITPPGAPHTHVNGGNEMMKVLIVQDGGLHYHCRTMDFDFCDRA